MGSREPGAPRTVVVAIVEDHAILRDILVEYVRDLPQVSACTSMATAEQALDDLERASPDLMLVDLSLPGMSGIELIAELHRRRPGLMCAVLSGHRSRRYSRKALEAGADAYLLKGDPAEIEKGMEAMLSGRRYISEGLEDPH